VSEYRVERRGDDYVVIGDDGKIDSLHAILADAEARAKALKRYAEHAVRPLSRSTLYEVINSDPVVETYRKALPARGAIKRTTEEAYRRTMERLGADIDKLPKLGAINKAAAARRQQGASMRDRAMTLKKQGMRQIDIAKALGVSARHVRTLLKN
jgi:hypothetical protein